MTKQILLSLVMVLAAFIPAKSQDIEVSAAEREKIERVITEYIVANPELVEAALIELNRRRTVAKMLPTIDIYRSYLERDPNAGVMGNPNGDVTIVEFFDYRCGYCKRHFGEVRKLVEDDGNIRWVLRHFPVLDRPEETPVSRIAARAGEAAVLQGKFSEFHIAVMTSRGALSEARIYELATSVGLNVAQLKKDMTNKILEKRIVNSLAVGQDIGFTGTPGYIIGEDVVLGAAGLGRMKEAVNRARAASKVASR
ncbi:MAG: DsbA family protein [Kordiimonadaceae bacterium]|nr:DsbA family protein [Kordiimonadaceae bacterium]